MSNLGLIVSAGRKGSQSLWMRTNDRLAAGRKPPDPKGCMVEMVRKYIERYGPVTREDIAYWSFLRKDDVVLALDAPKKDVTREHFRTNEGYYSFGGESREASEPPSVIILPEFDSLMMGYKDKSRFLPHDRVKKVFWGLGGIHRTILLDGFVAATWKRKKTREGMTVDVSPLRRLTAGERRSVEGGFANYADYQGTKFSVQFKR